MDKPTQLLQDIFNREIDRLDSLSQENPLTIEQVDVLFKLVKAYSTFKARDADELDEYSKLSAEEIEERLKEIE